MVHLTRTDERSTEVDALVSRLASRGGGRVGVCDLRADLSKRARRTLAPGLAVRRALTWDAADRADRRWWPQGVTLTPYADLLVVSWYAKDGGSRLTFVDLATRRYRHVLLVAATAQGIEPLRVHAGGIAWSGEHLHVAATARGFMTCRISDLLRVGDLADSLDDYRYVLPVWSTYRAEADDGEERLRFSFLSLDATGDVPALVVGEYGRREQTRRLGRFDLDPATGLLVTDETLRSTPALLDDADVRGMQGAAVLDGRLHVTVSHGPRVPGSLYVGRPGAWTRRRWATPMGPEDLAADPATGLLWTVTEHPHRRWLVALRP